MENSIIFEYKSLISDYNNLKNTMENFPSGYISNKIIKGKVYYYLQSRMGGKINSRYLKADEVPLIRQQIEDSKKYKSKLIGIECRISELENAAKLIDKNLSRQLSLIKLTDGLDELSHEQKEKSISFASAMNAIEGVPASHKANIYIDEWKNGGRTYLSALQDVLKMYGLNLEVENA